MAGSPLNGAEARRRLYQQFPDLANLRELVEPAVQLQMIQPGSVLFARGNPVDQLFFLLDGQAEEQGLRRDANGVWQARLVRTVTPTALRPMPVLGLYDYLYGQRHSTHAVAGTQCQVLVMAAPVFEKILYLQPELPAALAPLSLFDRLRTIPLLSSLDRIELHYVSETANLLSSTADELLFAGANPDFYLIDQGQVEVQQNNGQTALLGNGAALGIPGLDLQGQSLVDSSVIRIARQALHDLAPFDYEGYALDLRQAVQNTLGQLYAFSDPVFSPDVLNRLAGYVSHYTIPTNTILAQQGELSDSMWVLMPGGRALVHALDESGHALLTAPAQGPNSFGEAALMAQATVESTLEAEAGGQWLRLQRADFQHFLRTAPPRLLDRLKVRGEVQLYFGDELASERYPWLQEGEGVIWPTRRHWVVLLRKTWLSLLLLVVILLAFSALSLIPGWQIGAGFGLTLVGALVLAIFLWGFYDYWNDYLVVTNQRLVREERVLLQSQRVQETGLEQVRNVDIAKNFAGQWLGYGLLKVQTAGTLGTIAFDFVPEVERVQRALIAQMNRRRHYRAAASKLEIQRHLEGRLGRRLILPERVYRVPNRSGRPPALPGWLAWLGARRQRRSIPRYEQDHIIWRKHWLNLAGRIFWPGLILYGLVVLLFGNLLFLPLAVSSLLAGPFSLLLVLAGLVDLAVVAWQVADWRNDTYEVTRDEIADVERLPLFFDEQRRTARLVAIDNIRLEIPSTLHYLFNFGDVRLETAATQGEFTFDSVPDPTSVAEIRRRIEAARRREEQERARQRARELTDWFELYDRLKPEQPETGIRD